MYNLEKSWKQLPVLLPDDKLTLGVVFVQPSSLTWSNIKCLQDSTIDKNNQSYHTLTSLSSIPIDIAGEESLSSTKRMQKRNKKHQRSYKSTRISTCLFGFICLNHHRRWLRFDVLTGDSIERVTDLVINLYRINTISKIRNTSTFLSVNINHNPTK